MPTFGSLFAGIGGIDLGLERAGWECRFQVEWDPFCQRVLAKHWPDVPRYGDIRDVHGAAACPMAYAAGADAGGGTGQREGQEPTNGEPPQLLPDASGGGRAAAAGDHHGCLPYVDLLAGGFPCQPVSFAGRRAITDDDRWLWPEFARTIRELRPRYVLVENVPGLLVGGGMDAVLGDLAELGYDTEWESIPAAAVGAPHLRYRVWIVAYARRLSVQPERRSGEAPGATGAARGEAPQRQRSGYAAGDGGEDAGPLADANGERGCGGPTWIEDAADVGQPPRRQGLGYWDVEPDVGRVAHGVPARVDRLRSLGNAVVPQVVEFIGRRILEAERVA